MQVVKIPEHLHTPNLLEKGVIIMPGRRGVGTGFVRLIPFSENGHTDVMVNEVDFKPLRDMDVREAKDELLDDLKMLKRYLKRSFPNVDDSDIFTILRWNPTDEPRED